MAAAYWRGAGWVLARPLRQPRTGNTHDPDKPTADGSFPAPGISRRMPASSSFVLAAARLRALQLDPSGTARRPGHLRRRLQKNSQPSPAARAVTGSGSHALLTLMTLMGAAIM